VIFGQPLFIVTLLKDSLHRWKFLKRRWIVFLFTKDQLKDRLGYKTFFYLKPGKHLEKAIYFNAEKRILNLELCYFSLQDIFRACSLVPDPFVKAVVFRHIQVADSL
jgi:hypothetical protein